jgi:squalene-hopene/tetraprenyl-beta-curcumene cyclase
VTVQPPQYGLAYPAYTAAMAVIALARQPDARLRAGCDAWLKYLRDRQLTEALGWEPDDAFYGGWGYAGDFPQKPELGQPLAPLAEPNLSATVFALQALRAAGLKAGAPEVQKALAFVRRCQNFTDESAGRDAEFDDGGFFFIQNDPVRNKAGVAGTDTARRERYASYGSATADGLRALVLCGLPADEPRVAAAWGWIEKHFSVDTHPGGYVKQREAARRAVYFYYCHSLAATLLETDFNKPRAEDNRLRWAEAMAEGLLKQQRYDGSWANAAVDVREDDPLVATSLAAGALAICRTIIAKRSSISIQPALRQ